uniref:BHLH domain-containing protein n=1 Tax=Eptatretus burgeri TaxID=7764 RepID=A0A8C4QZQ2_EPTBU
HVPSFSCIYYRVWGKSLPARQPGAPSVNPSRRHRLRFNSEMEKLARLLPLPPHVRARLDKLSVLRVALAFLRSRAAFQGCGPFTDIYKALLPCYIGPRGSYKQSTPSCGAQLLLNHALNGFVIVITMNGTIFYASHTVEEYLGFHQVGNPATSLGSIPNPTTVYMNLYAGISLAGHAILQMGMLSWGLVYLFIYLFPIT